MRTTVTACDLERSHPGDPVGDERLQQLLLDTLRWPPLGSSECSVIMLHRSVNELLAPEMPPVSINAVHSALESLVGASLARREQRRNHNSVHDVYHLPL
jgi:hypothetical protein